MEWLVEPQAWVALATLTALEIVLGIDNIVMISILADRLPAERQPGARKLGLALALITRVLLLLSLAWIIGLTRPLFTVVGLEISGRDLLMLAGGLFLIAKAVHEIHHNMEEEEGEDALLAKATSFGSVIAQIVALDVVFSLDSVITAVGMVDEVAIMITAVVIAVVVMIISIEPIARFVREHPTVKMLALSFLILIGVALVAEAFDQHLPRGYIYFAFGFSIFVESLNLRMSKGGRKARIFRPGRG